jgi:hypothetical protein
MQPTDSGKKRKLDLISRLKLRFSAKAGGNTAMPKGQGIADKKDPLPSSAEEWPLHEDGYYTYTRFNNEGFYN